MEENAAYQKSGAKKKEKVLLKQTIPVALNDQTELDQGVEVLTVFDHFPPEFTT